MPIEWAAIILLFLSSRWAFILAKRFDKPRVTYTLLAVLVFFLGGALLAFIATFIVLLIYGEFAFNYRMLVAAFFTLLGTLSVGIYYLILRRIWQKQLKSAASNKEILDNNLNS